jgi:hypothetical protein
MHVRTVSTASIVAKMAALVAFVSKNPVIFAFTKMSLLYYAGAFSFRYLYDK